MRLKLIEPKRFEKNRKLKGTKKTRKLRKTKS